jgi:hypothetical protein
MLFFSSRGYDDHRDERIVQFGHVLFMNKPRTLFNEFPFLFLHFPRPYERLMIHY